MEDPKMDAIVRYDLNKHERTREDVLRLRSKEHATLRWLKKRKTPLKVRLGATFVAVCAAAASGLVFKLGTIDITFACAIQIVLQLFGEKVFLVWPGKLVRFCVHKWRRHLERLLTGMCWRCEKQRSLRPDLCSHCNAPLLLPSSPHR